MFWSWLSIKQPMKEHVEEVRRRAVWVHTHPLLNKKNVMRSYVRTYCSNSDRVLMGVAVTLWYVAGVEIMRRLRQRNLIRNVMRRR